MLSIGHIASIVRYPVKSMAGESLKQALLKPSGLEDDRLYAFQSSNAPPGMLRLSGKERRTMLGYRASVTDGHAVSVATPSGETYPVDSPQLIEYFQTHISRTTHFQLTRSEVPQTDVRPLSLLSRQTINQISSEVGRSINERRFRANLILDLTAGSFAEDEWIGERICIGESAIAQIIDRIPRCRVVTHDPINPEFEEPLFSIMKTLDRFHQGRAGVYAKIVQPGIVFVNDDLRIAK